MRPGGAERGALKGSQSGPVGQSWQAGPGVQGSPRDRAPQVGSIERGPGCPGDLAIAVVSSTQARGTKAEPLSHPQQKLFAPAQIPGFASGGDTETRTGFEHILLPHRKRL